MSLESLLEGLEAKLWLLAKAQMETSPTGMIHHQRDRGGLSELTGLWSEPKVGVTGLGGGVLGLSVGFGNGSKRGFAEGLVANLLKASAS